MYLYVDEENLKSAAPQPNDDDVGEMEIVRYILILRCRLSVFIPKSIFCVGPCVMIV